MEVWLYLLYFIDIGLVAVLYDYNFPKQDLLKNSLIAFFLLLSLCLFNPFYSDEAAVYSVKYLHAYWRSHCTKRSLQNRHPKMGVNKKFIINITSSAKKSFLKSLKQLSHVMDFRSLFKGFWNSIDNTSTTRKLPDE